MIKEKKIDNPEFIEAGKGLLLKAIDMKLIEGFEYRDIDLLFDLSLNLSFDSFYSLLERFFPSNGIIDTVKSVV